MAPHMIRALTVKARAIMLDSCDFLDVTFLNTEIYKIVHTLLA